MGLIRRSVYGSSADLTGQARDEEVVQENAEDKMDLDDSSEPRANGASVDESKVEEDEDDSKSTCKLPLPSVTNS